MSFVSIRTKLLAILNARKTATVLGEVFDGEQDQQRLDISAYPVAELRRSASEADYFTAGGLGEDLNTYVFDIWLYSELENVGTSVAEKALDVVLDDLIYQFAHDRTLTGTADGGVRPTVTKGGFVEWRGKLHAVAVLTVRCLKIQDNA
ncbi:MAG: hypothetical protein WCV84_04640 [Patescibacteria group bacterium]